MHASFHSLREVIVLGCTLGLILTGCNSSTSLAGNIPPGQVVEQLSELVPVDEEVDNAPMLEYMTSGLIVTIEIVGSEAHFVEGFVALVPKEEPRKDIEGCFQVIGIREGREVTANWVPDPRWVAIEHVGVEERELRVVSFSLPLETRIDLLVIQIEPEAPMVEIEVGRIFEDFCRGHPDDPLCR